MNYKVTMDISPVYELLGSFMIYVTKKWTDNLDIGWQWISELDTRLTFPVRTSLAEASGWPFTDYDVLFALVIIREDNATIPSFLNWLQDADLEELTSKTRKLIPQLTLDEMMRIRTNYKPLLDLWHEHYFSNVEDEYVQLLREDAKEKEMLLPKMDPEDLIEYASGGVVLDDIAVNQVVLYPGIHLRPINTYSLYENLLLIQYPVDVPEENDDEPPMVLLRMTKALANPDRLRLLRYVADQPKTVTEMETDLNQSYEKLMHHMMILRAAGLLRVHLDNEVNERFSLRPDGPSELQLFLESYIRL